MIASVVGPFAEAVRATFQPCTFLLIVPILTAVAAARASWQVLVASVGAAVIGGWVLVDNRWVLDGAWLRVSALVVVGLLILLVAPSDAQRVWSRVAIVGVVTLIATLWWRPCVGRELGEILNRDGLAGQLVPMAAYMFGTLVPVAAIVAIRYAVQPTERVLVSAHRVAAVIGVVVATSLVAGQHDDIVVTLTRWTLG